MSGQVYLVGAGPGDPGLLTLRAKELIQEADLIIYDYLANPTHLRFAKKNATLLGVGKGFRHKTVNQEKIHALILKAAKDGKMVLRLKGGDPYLFGRGGEEALFLKEHGINFQVIPGVTSATAAASYAGIPLTHRDHNASVTFLTGHRANDTHLDSIAWKEIVGLNGTLVIYMGFYNLAQIAKNLIRFGMAASTKVCVIQWGTLPIQKSIEGNLETISDLVKKENIGAPCIIIIGDVVALRKSLNWYEALPLFRKKVVVTRMQEKAGVLSDKLAMLGGEIISLPTVEIKPLANYRAADKAIQNLNQSDWVIFTSDYGVQYFFERLNALKRDSRIFGSTQIAVAGPQTAAALKDYGITPDLLPKSFQTQGLLDEFKKILKNRDSKKITLFRTNIAPPQLVRGLKSLGAQINEVPIYQTKPITKIKDSLKKELLNGSINYVTFTSSSTVDNFVKMVGLGNIKKMLKKGTRFASIGPVTSKTLARHKLKVACQAKIFTIDGLIDAIKKLESKQ